MPQNSTTIRQFCSTDADAVIDIWRATLLSEKPRTASKELLIRKLTMFDDLVFVAERNSSVVGVALGGYDGVRGWLYGLAVAPKHHRRGIGRQLLAKVESTLRERGCPKVNLQVRASNREVVEFYRRCGYEVEERMSLGKLLAGSESLPIDPVPTIQVSDTISLSQTTVEDKPAFLKFLNESDEFNSNTASVPFPYTETDADQWIRKLQQETLTLDHSRSWAIRSGSRLIGGIGLVNITESERAEIGYWLAKPFWGQGIMSQAVDALCSFAFERYSLHRIEAQVFATNDRSAGVLRKAGFELEGRLRNYFIRNGVPVDALIFSRLISTDVFS